jgi:serine phosphatase RsbU (regulator of sigma subunit)
MENLAETPLAANGNPSSLSLAAISKIPFSFWKFISNIGLQPGDKYEYVRRAHLINRLSFCGALVSLFFAVHVYLIGHYYYLPFQITASLLVFGFMWFSAQRRFELALYWFYSVIFAKIFYSSLELKGTGVEYFFIPLGCMVFTILENLKTCILLFSIAILGFFISLLLRSEYIPHYTLSETQTMYTYIPVLFTTFILCVVMVMQYKTVSRRYEGIIHSQMKVVSEKNKEITDSITYAKHLQKAILPPVSLLDAHLPDYFLFYKPKDIVAGDFYWMEMKNDRVYIAAADCTGHGIPGSIVSVVCYNALNRALNEFNLNETGKILDASREIVLATFARSETEVKDGMDISLCSINFTSGEVQWSGANNPLWYVQNNTFKELAGDNESVGKTDHPKSFTTHDLKLSKGDMLYLVTDGYADQFGGEKGKKFKSKKLKKMLFDNSNRPVTEIRQEVSNTFKDWKGILEQVDDVTVIGIRI